MEGERLEQIKQTHARRAKHTTGFNSINHLLDIQWLIEEVERLRGIVGYIPLEEGD